MNSIYIAHNPFTVETVFRINDMEPAEGCKLTSYRESRLQQWVEKLFEELHLLFNGDSQYSITFKGVESDFLDIQEAALKAQQAGAEIQQLHWLEVPSAEHRLEQIRSLWNEVAQHPKIAKHVQNNSVARHDVKSAFNRDFDVYVVATMSSGKSTLINAMLGTSLLPAANEATTATIARIADKDSANTTFSAQRVNRDGDVLTEAETITAPELVEWNKNPDTFSIHMEGDIKAIRERDNVRLVLTDTPGPNNSQDTDHHKTTMSYILDSKRNPMILYILNGTQLGIQDDKNLLNMIAEAMSKGGKQSKDRFIFVVNKMDEFDPEKEDIPRALHKVRTYLQSNGISEPVVYPVSAEFTRLLRLPSGGLTRKELSRLKGFVDTFEEVPAMDLNQYMPVTERVKRNLEAKQLTTKEIGSGLPAVEAVIDEYIDKYNLPHRLKRVYDALVSVTASALNEAELMESLEHDEIELEKIRKEIARLEEKESKGFDAIAFKERLKNERTDLPSAAMQQLEEQRTEIGTRLRMCGQKFHGKQTIAAARQLVDEAKSDLQHLHTICVAIFERIYENSQDQAKRELKIAYEEFVKSVFSDANEIDFPTLEKLKNSVMSMSVDYKLELSKGDVQTRRVVAEVKKVSTSTWYKPWTWGDEESVNIYKDEEYVDLQEFWKKAGSRSEEKFRALQQDAIEEITNGHGVLVDRMLSFMNSEFEEKFKSLLDSIKENMHKGQKKEASIAEARAILNIISSIRQRLGNIISMDYANSQ